ncbi:MAG: RNA-binding protein [Gammaproteobacteria bacterium]|nr:RNA-binding protein [Gammaproteobacteria bacterium]MBT8124201.1 RNA-binding protein [Gammaproteobacteria bacterium]NNC66607.1 RNA-binding protein [Gammaproteobacteria bacterium]
MKLYVGNLPWSITDADLNELFSGVGEVTSATIITDRDSGRSRGFGFVEMAKDAGQQAIKKLSGHMIDNRSLRVNEANEKPQRERSRF